MWVKVGCRVGTRISNWVKVGSGGRSMGIMVGPMVVVEVGALGQISVLVLAW
ncbi:hypothetical protein KSS87_012970 [Heliosperma pusillum]|nr:hypothetical protein KSS87_012970 [Heliosperma pusillum]